MSQEKVKILYAKNPAMDYTMVEDIIGQENFDLITVSNADEVRQALKGHTIPLFIIHADDDSVGGTDLIKTIRNDDNIGHDTTAILALTRKDDPKEHGAFYECGADDILFEQTDRSALLETVYRLSELDGYDSFAAAASALDDRDLNDYLVLDDLQVKTFLNFIGLDRTRELIQEFKDYYEKKTEVFFDESSSPEELSKEFHAMASVSGNLGLKRFSMACRFLMDDLNESALPNLMDRLMELQNLYDTSLQKLNESIDQSGNDS